MKKTEVMVLLAVLNSSVTNYYVRHVGVIHEDGYTKFEDRFVKELPVRLTSSGERLSNLITDKVSSIKNLTSRQFPDYYIDKANTKKVGVSMGLFIINFKRPEVTIEIDSNRNTLKTYNIVNTLEDAIIVDLTRNDSIKCPSMAYWRYIELYLLAKCENRGGSIKVSIQTIQDIFIPTQEKLLENAIKERLEDQTAIRVKEKEIDDHIADLYELETVMVNNKPGER